MKNRAPVPERSPRKPKGLGHERREEILSAALSLFARHGVYAVTTRQISDAVGISQPALYAHFHSKDEICETLMMRAFQALEARQRKAIAKLPPERRIRRLAAEYVQFGLENPDAYRIAFMLEGEGGQAHSQSQALAAGLLAYGVLHQEVARLLAERGSAADPDLIGQCLWADLHGLVSLLLARSVFPWVPRKALIQTHIDMACRALDAL